MITAGGFRMTGNEDLTLPLSLVRRGNDMPFVILTPIRQQADEGEGSHGQALST